MKRTKIVHIITQLELGGAQQTALTLLRGLDREVFEPVLFCGRGGILDADLTGEFRTRFVPGLRREIRPWWDLWALIALYFFLLQEKPKAVHTHSSKAGVLGRGAAFLARVPVVVHTVHGFGFTPQQKKGGRAFFVFLEKFLSRCTSMLVFVSRANREEAQRRGIGSPRRSCLIRAAVDLPTYIALSRSSKSPPGVVLRPSEKLVTTIGPFKPQKNLGDFIRAARAVADRYPEVKFLVVGDGHGRSVLEKEISGQALQQRVLLVGWRRDIPSVLARTDIFCMTSLWEGLPMALVEAMAAALPSVVNAVDGCRDMVRDGDTGFLVPPGDVQGTARRLSELLSNPSLARSMGERARASIQREFDLSTMIDQHVHLYQTLLQNRSILSDEK